MHFLSFALKRAHWRCVQTFGDVAALYDLTPARFDLLHVLRQRYGEATQAAIRRVLGVGATTVSRMLQSLEKLGFVSRMQHTRDRRMKSVWLTPAGRERVDAILNGLVMTGHFDLAFEGCFQWPAQGAERTVRILFKVLRYLARKLGDFGSHMNPGEPPPALDPPWIELSPACAPRLGLGL
jgi:DNA-binding MarR family transcriptional regulator